MNEFNLIKISSDLIITGKATSIIIKSDKGHRLALIRVDAIFKAEPNTDEFEELEILKKAIHKYEEKHHSWK